MTMTKLQAALALAALGAWSALSAANFPVGTHVIKGSVMGYNESGLNILLSSESGVKIRAVNASGNVIAECQVKDPSADGVNFAMEIPLSKTATDSTCAVGDKLHCVMVEAGGILISTEPVTVGGALETQTVTLKMVDAQRYVSQDDAMTNDVAKAYVDAIQVLMEDFDGLSGKYDPFADYDGDGASNYAEYIAGTNPFDASDRLAIKVFTVGRETATISFEYVGGHVYGVKTTADLTHPAWMLQKVRASESGEELSQIAPATDPEADPGATTIYMTHALDAKQGFFKLEAK